MTYQVLARKWRPSTFEQLVGQDHVTSALIHALDSNRLHHAYLFSGTRGVGKTTVARILAKSLNCEKGVSASPCGECGACVDVDKGRFPDLIEVDAASRTKVEDTRELLDNVQYAPTSGRYKIYLIDEVHMLSGHSFNALLKTLEEPPSHVIFLLATTDPQKLPVTVLSRCLQFQLRPIGLPLLEKQFKHILDSEDISFEESAIPLLAQSARGSMRDGLSLLEQAIGIGRGQITRSSVEQMLGCTYAAALPALLQAIVAQDTPAALSLIQSMHENGVDFTSLMDAMLSTFHGWALASALGAQTEVSEFAGVSDEAIALYKGQDPEQIQLYYQITLKGKEDLVLAPSAKSGFEMTCLRLMHFRPFEAASQQPVQAQATHAQPMQQAVAPAPSVQRAPQARQTRPIPAAPASPKMMQAKPEPSVPSASGAPDWSDIAKKLQLVGLAKVLVQNCMISQWELPKVKLTLDARQAVCLNDDRKDKIEKALSVYLKQSVDLTITAGEVGQASPQGIQEVKRAANLSKAQQLLAEDEGAQKLIKAFDATVEEVQLISENEQEKS